MEELETTKEQETAKENEEITGKTATNSEIKPRSEKKANIIIAAFAGVLILSVAGTFIGAAINESNNTSGTPTPSFVWDTDRSGFFDKDGNFLEAGKSYNFTDKKDDADRKYIQITSIEAPKNAYAYVFPSYLNTETESLPIYAVGKELTHDEKFETNFATIKKNVFGFEETNKGITEIYFQSLYKEIGEYAFYECVDLERVEFRSFATGKQTISDRAFAECAKLKDVVLSDNLSIIGIGAFENDVSLETISIPKNIATIGSLAFKGTSLKNINYHGTKTEWVKVNKAVDWLEGLNDCKIHFLEDGTTESI